MQRILPDELKVYFIVAFAIAVAIGSGYYLYLLRRDKQRKEQRAADRRAKRSRKPRR